MAKERNGIALKRYAYVSLYGVNDIEQLRSSIVENSRHSDKIGELYSLSDFLGKPWGAQIQVLSKGFSALPVANKERTAIIQAITFHGVAEQIICLDDLERKGEKIKVREILGLASFLKEQRKCKVVLILNDVSFDKSDQEDAQCGFPKTKRSLAMN